MPSTDDRIDGYASAVLEFATAEGALARISDELFRVARAFEKSGELREALADRRIPLERKLGIVEDLLGTRTSPLTLGLVSFVVGAGRASDLSAIADRVATRAAAEEHRVIAEVRSAVGLDDDQVARLTERLGTVTGMDVDVKVVVDPSLMGGIVATIGDTVIDGSLRSRLEKAGERLQER